MSARIRRGQAGADLTRRQARLSDPRRHSDHAARGSAADRVTPCHRPRRRTIQYPPTLQSATMTTITECPAFAGHDNECERGGNREQNRGAEYLVERTEGDVGG